MHAVLVNVHVQVVRLHLSIGLQTIYVDWYTS